jgi:hypothetical protein
MHPRGISFQNTYFGCMFEFWLLRPEYAHRWGELRLPLPYTTTSKLALHARCCASGCTHTLIHRLCCPTSSAPKTSSHSSTQPSPAALPAKARTLPAPLYTAKKHLHSRSIVALAALEAWHLPNGHSQPRPSLHPWPGLAPWPPGRPSIGFKAKQGKRHHRSCPCCPPVDVQAF